VPHLSRNQIFIFALASGASVANVYYAQPLLDALAIDFHISYAAIGSIVACTQIGSVLALIFLVPLGDLANRRNLILTQLAALIFALFLISLAHSPACLLSGMLIVGLFGTAMTQGLIAYAANCADPQEQGHVIGTVQSGVFIGLLLARVIAGGINDLTGWRGVYVFSGALMLVIFLLLWRGLPDLPIRKSDTTYARLVFSMFALLKKDRVLQHRGLLALLMFATLNIFWNALVLLLTEPPFNYSHTTIGAFGLLGLAGAALASKAGRWADQGYAKTTTRLALLVLLLAWCPLSFAEQSLIALLLGTLLIDIGGQALHVTNQSYIFKNNPEQHSRKVSIYMLFYAAGSGIGAISTTYIFANFGWRGTCLLGSCICILALATNALRLKNKS
jgi:predicted MFS family arabinose efflux permease